MIRDGFGSIWRLAVAVSIIWRMVGLVQASILPEGRLLCKAASRDLPYPKLSREQQSLSPVLREAGAHEPFQRLQTALDKLLKQFSYRERVLPPG